MATPTLGLLNGLWTGTYSSFIYVNAPIAPPMRTNPIPKVGGDYTPAAAIISIRFDGNGTHKGKVLVNFAGTIALSRPFTGTYDVTSDLTLGTPAGDGTFEDGTTEGTIRLKLSTDAIGSIQTTILHFVMKNHEEMVFMIEEAHLPTGPTTFLTTAGGSAAQGTLTRVRPMGEE